MVRDQSQRSGVSSLCARDYFRSAECPFVLGPMYHLRKDGPWLSILPNKHDEHFGRDRTSLEGIVPRLHSPNKRLSRPVRQLSVVVKLYGYFSFQHIVRAGDRMHMAACLSPRGQSLGEAW